MESIRPRETKACLCLLRTMSSQAVKSPHFISSILGQRAQVRVGKYAPPANTKFILVNMTL